jgi:protocatechuate 3,4-dioxygenase beta subunit
VTELETAELDVAEPDVADVGVRTEPNGRGAVTAMGLSNSAVLSGRVTGPAGRPLVGAAVTITDFTGQQVARGRTAADGTYRLDLPTGGSFLLICAAEDHQPAAALVAVGAGEVHRDLLLVGAGLLVGRVAGFDGAPIVGATVTLTDARGEVIGAAVAGSDGEYELADLYPGDYTLTASAPGARPSAQTVSLDGAGTQRHDLILLANGAITGTVLSATSGLPVREAWVTLIDETGTVAASAQTGEDGRYDFTGLAPGGYVLTASGYAPVAARVELTGEGTDRHDVALGTPTAGV